MTIAGGRPLHLARQAAAVARMEPAPARYVVVSFDDVTVSSISAPPGGGQMDLSVLRRGEFDVSVVRQEVEGSELPLAAARNRAIAAAGDADLVLCLDVDCVPEPHCLAALADAAARFPGGALLAGPVGRLEAGEAPDADAFSRARAHARAAGGARPVLDDGVLVVEPRVELFWSLAFAVSPATHARISGFDEAYVGYGAEDTDYAFRARRAGVPLVWVGGAWAHHQHHAVSSPPVEHLDAIVANAHRFRERWGRWPMEGWLAAFAAAGLVDWEPDGERLRYAQPPK